MAKAFVKAMIKGPDEYVSKKNGTVYNSILFFANEGKPCDIKVEVEISDEKNPLYARKHYDYAASHAGQQVNLELDIFEGFEKDEMKFRLLNMTPIGVTATATPADKK
jgi:hypothetical protein